MNSDTATWVFTSILTVGAIVWIWSLAKALRLGLASSEADRWPPGEASVFDTEKGELTIRGEPESLSKDLIHSLQQSAPPIMGVIFKVTNRTSQRLILEKTGALMCNQPAGLYFSEAAFGFTPAGDGTVRVSYCLGYERLVRLLRRVALCVILGAGLPTILIVGMVVWYFVVQSNDPIVRWQVFQVLQIAHALWPPFLIMGFYRIGRYQSKNFIESLIASIEVLD